MERTIPLLVQKILPDIKMGKTVLVVAHANSLRGTYVLVKIANSDRHDNGYNDIGYTRW